MDFEINEKRMVQTFVELAKISSLSGREAGVARYLERVLKAMGAELHMDDAGGKTGGSTGNLIARFKGTVESRPFLLSAHMDTVGPAGHVKPVVRPDRVTSDGSTILGADCKSGIAIILETIKVLQDRNMPRPPIEAVFTVSEEISLLGAKYLDYSRIKARYGLIFDNERPLECVITAAPAVNKMDIRVYGIAAHSGVAPEQGISAIEVVSKAIAGMKLGRIDAQTTANIGVISGGLAINTIAPLVEMKGEVRSHDLLKLLKQTSHMEDCFRKAVRKAFVRSKGGRTLKPSYEFLVERNFPGLAIGRSNPVLPLIAAGMKEMGLKMKTLSSGGGTDANIMCGHGIETPILATGMRDVHTTGEYLDLRDFFNCARLAVRVAGSARF
ncbi:MAG: M20/M25/M40 family metallo-hydrolase [Elusimicrobiales bacterium]|jgi:tripeptide aminopeptidase